jgi:hypothetical protein
VTGDIGELFASASSRRPLEADRLIVAWASEIRRWPTCPLCDENDPHADCLAARIVEASDTILERWLAEIP